MSTSSAHADSEKAFLWQIEPFCFDNVEKKNGRDRAGGKAETKKTKIQRRYRSQEDTGATKGGEI